MEGRTNLAMLWDLDEGTFVNGPCTLLEASTVQPSNAAAFRWSSHHAIHCRCCQPCTREKILLPTHYRSKWPALERTELIGMRATTLIPTKLMRESTDDTGIGLISLARKDTWCRKPSATWSKSTVAVASSVASLQHLQSVSSVAPE